MTQEQKDLLLKDLCARLPYSVKAYVKNWSKFNRQWIEDVYTVESIDPSLNKIFVYSERGSVELIVGYDDYEIQPYLFPLSSITDEQRKEYESLCIKETSECDDLYGIIFTKDYYYDTVESIDYLYKNHIDVRCLIPMGLAIDATGLNIY